MVVEEKKVEQPVICDDGKSSELTIPASECKVFKVTVFTDRAEVTRRVLLSDLESGQHVIMVKGVSKFIDQNSIRAKGLGKMVLRSVGCEVNFPKVQEVPKDAAAEFDERIRVINQGIAMLNKKLERSKAEHTLLQTFVNNVMRGPGAGNKDVAPGWVGLNEEKLQSVSELLAYYSKASEEKDKRETEIKDQLRIERERVSKVNEEKQARGLKRVSGDPTHDVKVVLQAVGELKKAELHLTYMVSNASWSPSYDIRALSTSTDLSLTYYGTVRQSTDEKWMGVELSLSTAKPQVGGTPPELPTKVVQFKQEPVYQPTSMMSKSGWAVPSQAIFLQSAQPEMCVAASSMAPMVGSSLPLPAARVAVAEAKSGGGAGAATFKIAAATDVASDNKPQKVTICILELSTTMSHFCVPTESPHAYLQCRTVNTSAFELLASNEVNVFFDGSYVSKTKLPNVSPGESFQSFLGADSSVRIDAAPPSKVHMKGGYWSTTDSCRHTIVTKIKNTKDRNVLVICSKQLPRSSDKSIKVEPLMPNAAELQRGSDAEEAYQTALAKKEKGALAPTNYVKLLATKNNIVWKRTLKPQTEGVFKLQYTVEWPKGRQLQFS